MPLRVKTTLLVWTLNEIQGMRLVMPRVRREWVDQILVMDGGSTDGTLEFARDRGYQIYRQVRPGLRTGRAEDWKHIEGDLVVTFQPDGNCLPESLPELIQTARKGYDLVVISRYTRGARSDDDDTVTTFGNRMFTSMINLLFRTHFTDAMSGYRAYPRDLPHRLRLFEDESYQPFERWSGVVGSWESLMSLRVAKYGLTWAEVPGSEPARIGGARKLRIFGWGFNYMGQVLKDALIEHRPPARPSRRSAGSLVPVSPPTSAGSPAPSGPRTSARSFAGTPDS